METAELERLVGRRLRLTFEDIIDHPMLPEARRVYLNSFSKVFEGDPFLIRLLLEAGRFLVFHCAAILDAAQDPSRRETWFTISALKQQLALFGFASDRQVDHLVRRLCDVGFLERRQASTDRRVRFSPLPKSSYPIIPNGSPRIMRRWRGFFRSLIIARCCLTIVPSMRSIAAYVCHSYP